MSSEETTIRERLEGSLKRLEELELHHRKFFGPLMWQYVVDVSTIRNTVDGISNLETRCWNLRKRANEFKETLYSISDMMDSGEIVIPPSEFTPSQEGNPEQDRKCALELTRKCGALAISLYSQVRSLFYQKMEDTLQGLDRDMERWESVSSSSVSSKMAMMSSQVKRKLESELTKIMNNSHQVQMMVDAIMNPESGQTMDGFIDSTLETVSDFHSSCTTLKSELLQNVSDMFDQTLLALDDMNVKMKGNVLRTTSSISGSDFALECADDLFMMNSRTVFSEDSSESDQSSMKLAADLLLFSVDSMCQVVAFVSETTYRILEFAISVGTQMTDVAKELSGQMIDASSVASSRFLHVVGGISGSDMAKDYLPGLLDFVGDTFPDQDLAKDVVGTASRISQSLVALGKQTANEQLSIIGRRTSNMFENIHNILKKLASDTENVVEGVLGSFLRGQGGSFTDESDEYHETDSVMRMRCSIGGLLQTREKYNSSDLEASRNQMNTPWWKNQLEELKSQRKSYAEWGASLELDQYKPMEPVYPDLSLMTDEEKEKALAEYNKANEKYQKDLDVWQYNYDELVKKGAQQCQGIGYVDSLISSMEKAIKTGNEEDSRLAAKMFTELGCQDNSGYFGMRFSYNTDDERIVTGLQLCRNLGVWSYADDGSNLLKSFTADRTINHPFWQEVMKHEANGEDGIDKAILKAILSQDKTDMEQAMKKVLEKYGPGTRVGENAMSLATNLSLFGKDGDPEYWMFDGEQAYWKKLGVTKDNPLKIHEMLESDLFDDKVRDMYLKLQKTKDPEDMRKLFATMSQYIPSNSPLLLALKNNVKKKYGFNLDDYINDHFKEYTSEDWKKQLAEESARRKEEQSLISDPWKEYDPAAPLSDESSVESSSKEDDNYPLFYWKGSMLQFHASGIPMLMHDGDQQVFNPYGHPTGKWTLYSFRPQDTLTNIQEENYPMIAITPSSFQSLKTINTMLNSIPFVVVREFFFKNQAGQIVNFLKGVAKGAREVYQSAKSGGSVKGAGAEGGSQNAGTMEAVQNSVKDFIKKVQEVFQDVDIKTATIDIPYILYCGLREKQWGNTYIFPYIVDSGTVINESSNASEWGGEQGAGWLNWIKGLAKSATEMIGGAATSLVGSQAAPADLFPAPTWSNKSTDKISFSFSLVLINDHIIKARNNYMCVNTIIHNNRWMQKSILAFPGALYELWLPTGQRHLMCTGSFKLYPLGLNRFTPVDFFEGYEWDSKGGDKGLRGADFEIGTVVGLQGASRDGEGNLNSKVRMPNPHISAMEVIPDAYKLELTFTSCLANNLNTAVFQYYVKMAAFNEYNGAAQNDWLRNAKGDFSVIGQQGKNPLEYLNKKYQNPDANVDSTNTGNASQDNGTLPESFMNEDAGQNEQNDQTARSGQALARMYETRDGDESGDGSDKDISTVKHYAPLMTSRNNPVNLSDSAMMEVNYRIIQYNRGEVPIDSFFDTLTRNSYSDQMKKKIVDYVTGNDRGISNPANSETHNVPLIQIDSELGQAFSHGGTNFTNLNGRINDYNRGEITLDQFFASYSGIQGTKDRTKADVLNYLVENDKPENAPRHPRHSISLIPVPDNRLKSAWRDSLLPDSSLSGMAESLLGSSSESINIGINRYNAGEISRETFLNEWPEIFARNESLRKIYAPEKLRQFLESLVLPEEKKSVEGNMANNMRNVANVTSGQFIQGFGECESSKTIDGKVLTSDQLRDMRANKTQIVLRIINSSIEGYNQGASIDQAAASVVKQMNDRPDIQAMKDLGYTPERVERFVRSHLYVASNNTARSSGNVQGKRQRVYSRSQTSSETYIEKFNEATYNKKLQKLRTSLGDVPINADSAVLEIQNAQRTIRETTQFLSKLYNAENNNLWWKPFERENLYYTITPDSRLVLRQRYGEKFIQLKELEAKIQNASATLDRINEQLSQIPDLSQRNPLLEKKVVETRNLNKLEHQKDIVSDELIQIDTDLIRDAFDEHDAVVSVKRRDITVGVFQQVWNEKIMNSYERQQMQYLTSDEKKRYFDDKIREMSRWDSHGILKKRDWFFRVVVMDFIVGEMKVLVQWFKECTYQDFETVYRIVRKIRLLRLDFEQAVGSEDFKINRTNLFRMTEQQVMEFKKLDKILTGNTLYELFLSQLELQFPEESEGSGESSSDSGKVDREIVQEQESEENIFIQRTVRQDVVARYWGSETELTRAAYNKVCVNLNDQDEKITVYMGEDKDDIETFNTIRELKNEIMRLKISNDNPGRLQSLLGAFTSYVNLAKEAMVTEKMNEMRRMANEEIVREDVSVNARVMSEENMEDVPFPVDYK